MAQDKPIRRSAREIPIRRSAREIKQTQKGAEWKKTIYEAKKAQTLAAIFNGLGNLNAPSTQIDESQINGPVPPGSPEIPLTKINTLDLNKQNELRELLSTSPYKVNENPKTEKNNITKDPTHLRSPLKDSKSQSITKLKESPYTLHDSPFTLRVRNQSDETGRYRRLEGTKYNTP